MLSEVQRSEASFKGVGRHEGRAAWITVWPLRDASLRSVEAA